MLALFRVSLSLAAESVLRSLSARALSEAVARRQSALDVRRELRLSEGADWDPSEDDDPGAESAAAEAYWRLRAEIIAAQAKEVVHSAR